MKNLKAISPLFMTLGYLGAFSIGSLSAAESAAQGPLTPIETATVFNAVAGGVGVISNGITDFQLKENQIKSVQNQQTLTQQAPVFFAALPAGMSNKNDYEKFKGWKTRELKCEFTTTAPGPVRALSQQWSSNSNPVNQFLGLINKDWHTSTPPVPADREEPMLHPINYQYTVKFDYNGSMEGKDTLYLDNISLEGDELRVDSGWRFSVNTGGYDIKSNSLISLAFRANFIISSNSIGQEEWAQDFNVKGNGDIDMHTPNTNVVKSISHSCRAATSVDYKQETTQFKADDTVADPTAN